MKRRDLFVLTFLFPLLFASCLADMLNEKFGYSVPVTLTYTTEHAKAPSSKMIASGKELTKTELPELSEKGYDFDGWYSDEYWTTKIEEGYIISENTTLYAKWSTYSVPHAFYTYPNNCAPSEDASWCARATLLVLEASIQYPNGPVKYYYPVQLGNAPLLSNRQYRVNLTIHRPGSLDPNKPVTFDDVTPVITVTDWESGDSYNQEI